SNVNRISIRVVTVPWQTAVISNETASKPFAGRGRRGQGPEPAPPVREAQPLRPAQSLSIIGMPSGSRSGDDRTPVARNWASAMVLSQPSGGHGPLRIVT